MVDNIHLPETTRKVQYSTEFDITHYCPDVEVYTHHLDDDSEGCSPVYQCNLEPRPATQLITVLKAHYYWERVFLFCAETKPVVMAYGSASLSSGMQFCCLYLQSRRMMQCSKCLVLQPTFLLFHSKKDLLCT